MSENEALFRWVLSALILVIAVSLLCVGLFMEPRYHPFSPPKVPSVRKEKVTTGKDNVCIGACACASITTGSDNVFLENPKYLQASKGASK